MLLLLQAWFRAIYNRIVCMGYLRRCGLVKQMPDERVVDWLDSALNYHPPAAALAAATQAALEKAQAEAAELEAEKPRG